MAVGLEDVLTPEQQDALAFQAYLDAARDDPLKGYRHANQAAERLCLGIGEAEIYWRAPNSGGKTTGGCAVDVALARGLKSLGGTPLPPIRTPNVGWILTQSYKQQVDSSQKALLHWIGGWPHKIAWVTGETKGYIETVFVATPDCKHGMDEKCPTCSRIVFHCAESPSAVGGRIDWAHADEIPPEKLWREVRARFTAGRPFYRYITATPMERRFWQWIREDFKDCEGRRHPVGGRMELRSSLRDNRYLSLEQIERVLESWRGDAFFEARSRGDYVDAEGDCPFDVKALQRWQARVREPKIERLTIQAEQSFDDGRFLVDRAVEIEVFEAPIPGESYLAVADPSSGIKSDAHDPAGIHIYRRASRPVLAMRFNGYLEPYGLGNLASSQCTRYGKALLDIDMTGGYGANTVTACSRAGYYNLVRDYHEDRPGVTSTRFGFTITAVNRSEITTAIERSLLEDSVDMPSASVLSCLLGVTVDGKGKWLAGQGRHDEDMICFGRALHLMQTLPSPRPRRQSGENRLRSMLGLSAVRRRATVPTPRWNP